MAHVSEPPRIGVFVCHCGINIGGVVDVPKVVEYAKILPNVVHAEHSLYTCASDGLNKIKEGIKNHNLNRVVVASCTPRTHEPLFRATCEEAGLNKYLFEMANIRELCSWVHMHAPKEATEKAKDLIGMAIAKARLLEPQTEAEVNVEPSALVIGAGVSGMSAALCLANRGFKIYLIEREPEIGGMLRKLHKIYPTGQTAHEVLEPMVGAVKSHKRIELLTSTSIKDIKGFVGNFDITADGVSGEVKFRAGTIIVATGAEEYKPVGLYGYGEYRNVLTQLELEEILRGGKLGKPKSVIMILCVGARGSEGRTYCGRICCATAINNALLIKEASPETDVYILYRDLQTYGVELERNYLDARSKFIQFIKYLQENPPEVISGPGGKTIVRVYDSLLGTHVEIESDLIVLSTPLTQHEYAKELSEMLKVPLGPDGFFLEAHVKLRPIDFATDGIYVCGTAHGPKGISESIVQAYGATSRASIPMVIGKARSEAITAQVREEDCIGCGLCEFVCPYGAADLVRTDEAKWVSQITEIMCKGCGVCAVKCPAVAIDMKHFKRDQILAQIRTAFQVFPFKEEFEPKILAFTCNWCSYAGADLAGVSRIQYPPNVRVIRLMCSGRVDHLFIFEALKRADGILITGCHPPSDCHYVRGNLWAEARYEAIQTWMKEIGIEPERLRLAWVSASEGAKFADVMKDMVADMKKLGPSPLTRFT